MQKIRIFRCCEVDPEGRAVVGNPSFAIFELKTPSKLLFTMKNCGLIFS